MPKLKYEIGLLEGFCKSLLTAAANEQRKHCEELRVIVSSQSVRVIDSLSNEDIASGEFMPLVLALASFAEYAWTSERNPTWLKEIGEFLYEVAREAMQTIRDRIYALENKDEAALLDKLGEAWIRLCEIRTWAFSSSIYDAQGVLNYRRIPYELYVKLSEAPTWAIAEMVRLMIQSFNLGQQIFGLSFIKRYFNSGRLFREESESPIAENEALFSSLRIAVSALFSRRDIGQASLAAGWAGDILDIVTMELEEAALDESSFRLLKGFFARTLSFHSHAGVKLATITDSVEKDRALAAWLSVYLYSAHRLILKTSYSGSRSRKTDVESAVKTLSDLAPFIQEYSDVSLVATTALTLTECGSLFVSLIIKATESKHPGSHNINLEDFRTFFTSFRLEAALYHLTSIFEEWYGEITGEIMHGHFQETVIAYALLRAYSLEAVSKNTSESNSYGLIPAEMDYRPMIRDLIHHHTEMTKAIDSDYCKALFQKLFNSESASWMRSEKWETVYQSFREFWEGLPAKWEMSLEEAKKKVPIDPKRVADFIKKATESYSEGFVIRKLFPSANTETGLPLSRKRFKNGELIEQRTFLGYVSKLPRDGYQENEPVYLHIMAGQIGEGIIRSEVAVLAQEMKTITIAQKAVTSESTLSSAMLKDILVKAGWSAHKYYLFSTSYLAPNYAEANFKHSWDLENVSADANIQSRPSTFHGLWHFNGNDVEYHWLSVDEKLKWADGTYILCEPSSVIEKLVIDKYPVVIVNTSELHYKDGSQLEIDENGDHIDAYQLLKKDDMTESVELIVNMILELRLNPAAIIELRVK